MCSKQPFAFGRWNSLSTRTADWSLPLVSYFGLHNSLECFDLPDHKPQEKSHLLVPNSHCYSGIPIRWCSAIQVVVDSQQLT